MDVQPPYAPAAAPNWGMKRDGESGEAFRFPKWPCEAGDIVHLDDVPYFYEHILMDGRSSAVF